MIFLKINLNYTFFLINSKELTHLFFIIKLARLLKLNVYLAASFYHKKKYI